MGVLKSIKTGSIRAMVAALRGLGFPRKRISPDRRFLVVSTTGVGDTLWGVPAIRALRESFRGASICVLTNSSGAEVLRGNPDIDDIIVFDRRLPGFFRLPGLIRRLRAYGPDTAFIFHASDRIVWPIVFLSGASEIIGYEGDNKGLDFVLTRALRDGHAHHIDRRLFLVGEIGANTKDKSLSIHLLEDDRSWADGFVKSTGLGSGPGLVGLHPGSKDPFKNWPAENFIRLGSELAGRHRLEVVVTGGPEEERLAREVASRIGGAVSVAGRLTLRQTAALIERLRLFVTNDTGPMHMAFALGTPTVALFCPTDPSTCGPLGPGRHEAIRKPITCTPCLRKKCRTPKCMEQISIEEVLASAERLLGGEGSVQ